MDRVTIILLKRHLHSGKGTPDELVYTGKTTDANKLARLMPVFISFVIESLPSAKSCHPAQRVGCGAGRDQVAMSVERVQSDC